MPDNIWPVQSNPSNPYAVPVLDGWGWDNYWDISDWIAWHSAMNSALGNDEANRRFLVEWNKQGFGASPLSARTFDTEFKNYAERMGFADGLYRNAYGANLILEPVADITSGIGEVSKGVSFAGSALKYALPVVIVAAVAFVVYSYAKKGARAAS